MDKHPPPTHHHPQQLFSGVSQLPVVGSEHVRTLFDSTQSQESKSEVGVRNRTRQCALGPILRQEVNKLGPILRQEVNKQSRVTSPRH